MLNGQKIKIWVQAVRPQTLSAAFVPVLIGAALAEHDGQLNWSISLIALLCAFLIQIGTNFANDYFDSVKGADTKERIGFERATASGLISQEKMLAATIITMSLAFLCGLYIVWQTGWLVLAIGICCLICGILYTGGPFPLGYNGLGDLFVFLFFGVVAVTVTYYVNALEWSLPSFWASLAVGALATNILVVNNLRDIDQDRPAGKNTLGVLFGENVLRWEYVVMLAIALAIPPHFYFRLDYSGFIFLPYLTIPLAVLLLKQVWKTEKQQLNKTLKLTALLMMVFGMLFSTGVLVG